MPAALPLAVEPLARNHDRKDFDCGVPVLNDYLLRQAAQDMRRGVSRVYVAHERLFAKVPGYYTLSAASFAKKTLPDRERKRLPHYPVPAVLLGRLAVRLQYRKTGMGKYLLFDAFRRVLQAAEVLAAYALVVDAKDDEARSFYQHYGFLRFPKTPSRLFIPIETLRRAAEP